MKKLFIAVIISCAYVIHSGVRSQIIESKARCFSALTFFKVSTYNDEDFPLSDIVQLLSDYYKRAFDFYSDINLKNIQAYVQQISIKDGRLYRGEQELFEVYDYDLEDRRYITNLAENVIAFNDKAQDILYIFEYSILESIIIMDLILACKIQKRKKMDIPVRLLYRL